MKKLSIGIVTLFVCVALAIWSPWLYIKFDIAQLFGVDRPEEISGLQVYSLAGEIEIYLDGELKGISSADKSPFILDRVQPGDYLITLKRKSDIRNSYWDFNKLITFTAGTSVIVSYNLGPEEEFSEGHIIYATPKENSSEKSKLNIETNIDDPEVSVEDLFIQKINSNQYSTELDFQEPKKISVSKSGYDKLEFTILPDSEDERNALSGFNLNVDMHLMLQPVMVE